MASLAMTDDAFSHWIPLTALTPDEVPNGPGMVQVKLAGGLIDYPSGRSAMVGYRAGASCRELASVLYRELPASTLKLALRFRLTDDPAALLTRLQGRFEERFGAPPTLPEHLV